MCHRFAALTGLIAACLTASSAAAQQGDWGYEGTLYLFTAQTETSIATPAGTIDSTLSFNDALSNLDFAFMGAFSASNGKVSLLLDYMYTDLSFEDATPGPVFSAINSSVKMQILSAYGGYRVHDTPKIKLDLAAGLRWFDTQTTLAPQPARGKASVSVNQSWVMPIVGARAVVQLSDLWAATAAVDFGGFGNDEETAQALLTVDYAITESWVLRGGYRYISVDHESGDRDFSFSQSGAIVGAAYRF